MTTGSDNPSPADSGAGASHGVADGPFGIIAGNGRYPQMLARAARAAGETRIVAAAFERETDQTLRELVDEMAWMRVGQLGRMIRWFQSRGVRRVVMAGQIAPRNLFELRPDFKALMILARLRERNAETLFGAIARELENGGVHLLPATTHLEDQLAPAGRIAGPAVRGRTQQDIAFGLHIAREIARLDIGQTVLVRNGTVLAVEGFDGTNATITRGGALGRGDAVMVKVSKPNQDMRFDVPVIGPETVVTAEKAGVRTIAVEARRTLILDASELAERAGRCRVSVFGC